MTTTSVNLYERFYTYVIYILNILYLITITGFYYIRPEYIETVRTIVIYYIIFLLFVFFNPYYQVSLGLNDTERSNFERKIAFSSGMFLLFTMGITRLTKLFKNTYDTEQVLVSKLFQH